MSVAITNALIWIVRLTVVAALAVAGPAVAQQPSLKLTVFVLPGASIDSVWMADAKGFYKAEGLDVAFRVFPSGTTALQTFRAGEGDIVFNGDLPGLQYWQNSNYDYRVITPLQRDAKGYIVMAKNEIKTPQDLAGKTVATRVGSTGSWFISEFLDKNHVDAAKVTVKNLDPQNLPAALCRGDIDAFFIWQPSGTRAMEICGDKIHQLSNAVGYVKGYTLAAARASYLATPEGADKVTRFIRATRKGAEAAAADFPAVVAYVQQKFGMSENATKEQYDLNERVLRFDKGFYDDFCSESRWAQKNGAMTGQSDLSKFAWPDGTKAIDPTLVVDAPPPC